MSFVDSQITFYKIILDLLTENKIDEAKNILQIQINRIEGKREEQPKDVRALKESKNLKEKEIKMKEMHVKDLKMFFEAKEKMETLKSLKLHSSSRKKASRKDSPKSERLKDSKSDSGDTNDNKTKKLISPKSPLGKGLDSSSHSENTTEEEVSSARKAIHKGSSGDSAIEVKKIAKKKIKKKEDEDKTTCPKNSPRLKKTDSDSKLQSPKQRIDDKRDILLGRSSPRVQSSSNLKNDYISGEDIMNSSSPSSSPFPSPSSKHALRKKKSNQNEIHIEEKEIIKSGKKNKDSKPALSSSKSQTDSSLDKDSQKKSKDSKNNKLKSPISSSSSSSVQITSETTCKPDDKQIEKNSDNLNITVSENEVNETHKIKNDEKNNDSNNHSESINETTDENSTHKDDVFTQTDGGSESDSDDSHSESSDSDDDDDHDLHPRHKSTIKEVIKAISDDRNDVHSESTDEEVSDHTSDHSCDEHKKPTTDETKAVANGDSHGNSQSPLNSSSDIEKSSSETLSSSNESEPPRRKPRITLQKSTHNLKRQLTIERVSSDTKDESSSSLSSSSPSTPTPSSSTANNDSAEKLSIMQKAAIRKQNSKSLQLDPIEYNSQVEVAKSTASPVRCNSTLHKTATPPTQSPISSSGSGSGGNARRTAKKANSGAQVENEKDKFKTAISSPVIVVSNEISRKVQASGHPQARSMRSASQLPAPTTNNNNNSSSSENEMNVNKGNIFLRSELQAKAYNHVVKELIETERSYVRDLHVIIEVFKQPMLESGLINAAEAIIIFSNIDVILNINSELLSRMLIIENKMNPNNDYNIDMYKDKEEELTVYINKGRPNQKQVQLKVNGKHKARDIIKLTQEKLVTLELDSSGSYSGINNQRLQQNIREEIRTKYANWSLVDATNQKPFDPDINFFYSANYQEGHPLEAEFLYNSAYSTSSIGECLLQMANYLKVYIQYCSMQPKQEALISQLKEERDGFAKFLKTSMMKNPRCRHLDLSSFLITPLQRVCKYPLLMRELIAATPTEHKDFKTLKNANTIICDTVLKINNRSKEIEQMNFISKLQECIEGKNLIIVKPGRTFVEQGKITYFPNKKALPDKSIAAKYFLFNDIIIITHRKEENRYKAIASIDLKGCLVNDFNNHPFSFEISKNGKITAIIALRNDKKKQIVSSSISKVIMKLTYLDWCRTAPENSTFLEFDDWFELYGVALVGGK